MRIRYMTRIKRREVDDPIEEPVNADDTVSIDLSHLFKGQQQEGYKAEGDGRAGDDGVKYRIGTDFHRMSIYLKT